MDTNLEIMDAHLDGFFKELEQAKGLSSCVAVLDVLDNHIALRPMIDLMAMREAAAALVMELAIPVANGELYAADAMLIAQLIQQTAYLLGTRMDMANAVDDLQEKPHVLH